MADEKDEPFGKAPTGETAAQPGAAEKLDGGPPLGAQDPEEAAGAFTGETAPGPPKIGKVKNPSRAPALAAALIAGVVGGFGGAFALRYVDTLQGPAPVDRVAELNARADALERKSEASAAVLAALESRVAAVQSGAAKAAASTDAALSGLRAAFAARPAATTGAGQAEAPDLGPVEEKIDALEKKLGSLDAVQQKLAAIETSLAGAKADPRAKDMSAAHSKGVVAASLVQLVSRGEPFANDVDALENLGVDPAKLAPLRAAAATGVASISNLSDEFAGLAPSLDTPEAPAPDSSILERLARDASSLVRIRRAGDPHDTDIPGRIAAIEGALARLDVAKAYAVWLQLPDAARVKSAKWGAAAKARLDALSTASAIEADAVTALGKPKS